MHWFDSTRQQHAIYRCQQRIIYHFRYTLQDKNIYSKCIIDNCYAQQCHLLMIGWSKVAIYLIPVLVSYYEQFSCGFFPVDSTVAGDLKCGLYFEMQRTWSAGKYYIVITRVRGIWLKYTHSPSGAHIPSKRVITVMFHTLEVESIVSIIVKTVKYLVVTKICEINRLISNSLVCLAHLGYSTVTC